MAMQLLPKFYNLTIVISIPQLNDIIGSKSWNKAYSQQGFFKGEKRGVSAQLSTDGVNPFSSNKVVYSMWPIMLTVLNLPKRIRNLFSNMMLVGIIPGNGNQEPKHVDPYLEIVVFFYYYYYYYFK